MTIDFTEQELNIIADALGRMPYASVAKLVANIQTQINNQNDNRFEQSSTS